MLHYITQQTQLPSKSVENTISLLNEDATIPLSPAIEKKELEI